MLCSTPAEGQCINCHNYQQYNPDRMQFHARQNMGGTVINYKVPKTGDPADPLLWACVAALGLAALFLMWRLLKESKDDR